MKKRFLSFVLAVIMIIGMLPITTVSAATTKGFCFLHGTDYEFFMSATDTGTPKYGKNKAVTMTDSDGNKFTGWTQETATVADETTDEWNTKFYYDKTTSKWTLIMKGAKIDIYNDDTDLLVSDTAAVYGVHYKYDMTVIVTEDSYLSAKYAFQGNGGGSSKWSHLIVESEPDATLYTETRGYFAYTQCPVTLNANIELNTHGNSAIYMNSSKIALTINGGNITGSCYKLLYGNTTKHNLVLNGGNITASFSKYLADVTELVVKDGLCHRFVDSNGSPVAASAAPTTKDVRFESFATHTSGDVTIENETEESFDKVVYCTVCNGEVSRVTVPLDCPHEETVLQGKVEATCGKDGYTGDEVCTLCDEIAVPGSPISATGDHSLVQVEAKAPTCGEVGWEAYEYCENCDHTTKVEIPTNSEHAPVQVEAKAATCAEAGWEAYEYCPNCSSYSTKVEIPALGHNYITETVLPTIFSKGYTTYTCTKCGDTYDDDFTPIIRPVAIIGTTPYDSLKEAIAAAEDGDTIQLRKTYRAEEGLYIDKDITIDFYGFHCCVIAPYENAAMVIAPDTKVTLTDSKASGTSKFMVLYVDDNNTVCCLDFNYLIKNAGTLNVDNVILNGNNLFGQGDTYTIENTGTLNLNQGTVVYDRVNALINKDGTVFKADNTVIDTPAGYHFDQETGILEAHDYTRTPIAATVYERAHDLFTCECSDSYKIYTGNNKLVAKAKNITTDRLYATLPEAIAEAQDGQLIQVLKDDAYGSTLIIPDGLKITIDLKGYYYAVKNVQEYTAMVIGNGAEVNLISTGATSMLKAEYQSYWKFNSVITNNGTLNLDNVTVNGNNLFNNGARAIVNNGTLTLKDDVKINIRQNDSRVDVYGGESDSINNLTGVNAPMATLADLDKVDVDKTATAGGAITLHPGQKVTYTITVTNNNDAAVSVNITDTLPKGVTLVSGCDDMRGSELCWTEKNIAPSETRTITYTVKNIYTLAQIRASETDTVIQNTAFKVVGKEITPSAEDIWVLETFNKEDRRKMEMAIDSMVTANLNVTNPSTGALNQLTHISMMYNVGFTVGAGFGTTDPNEVLTLIFDKAGQTGSGSSSGGVEDVTDTASNLLDRVAPTLYGGTAVPAEKDILFRGPRATSVTAADLISGDVLFVNESGATKLYIYDGTYLVEMGATKVTTNITPATILDTLPSADKWVVLRLSINLNITFSLNEGEYFNDADKNGYTELEKQMIATAEAYLLRGDRNQYTDDMTGTGQYRWQSATKLPEDCTVDQYGYSNCAGFTYDVQWATYGYAPKANNSNLNTTSNLASSAAAGWNPETLTGTYKSTVFYYEPPTEKVGDQYVSTLTDAEKAALKQQICSLLRPGDIICIRRTTGSGHAMLYVGNGTIIHSSGSSYNDDKKMETHEATIRFRMVEDLFDASIYAHTSCVYNLKNFSIVRPQNLITDPTATENTVNRVNNMQGIVAEKVVSTAMGKTVNPGDTITYTFYVFNTNKTEKEIAIRDVLSEYVTFVSATDNGSCTNGNISWDITVPAETRISVSYTVKVNEGVAAYTAIDGTQATINGVMHRCPNAYVANTLTAEQQQALVSAVETVKAMDVSALNSVEIAELIYQTAFGVDDLFGEEVTNFSMLIDGGNNQVNKAPNADNPASGIVKGKDNVGVFNDAWHWESKNFSTVALMNYNTSKPAMMVAPGMWGGQLVMNSTYNKNNRDERFTRFLDMTGGVLRSRLFWEKDLVVGDIFLMKGVSSEWMFIYIGNGNFATISAGTTYTAFQEVTVTSLFQYAPHDTWKKLAILRPSFQLDI